MWMNIGWELGTDGIVHGTLTKNRNGRSDEKPAFKVRITSWGLDEDGDGSTCGDHGARLFLRIMTMMGRAEAYEKREGHPVDFP